MDRTSKNQSDLRLRAGAAQAATTRSGSHLRRPRSDSPASHPSPEAASGDTEFRQLNETVNACENLHCIQQHPARYLETSGASAGTAILCLTHDPRIDDLTLMEAVNTPAFYIGAMGSAKNSQRRLQRLTEHGGVSEQALKRIHAPIGLPIGSKTPAEIALATLADIVRVRNGL